MENKENLESLGQEIATKCKGLPLAAKTLEKVLHCKSSEDKWHSILKCELWKLPQDRNSRALLNRKEKKEWKTSEPTISMISTQDLSSHKEMPNSVGYLMYLWYLNVSGNRIQSLPRFVYKLLALQTLKLSNCPKLIALPDDMKNLSNLRHLKKLEDLAKEMENLLTLEKVKMDIIYHKSKTSKTGEGSPSTSLLPDEGIIVGRQQDKEIVIKFLGEKHDDVSIIPLVRIGGIGKTALAQLVLNDKESCKDFKKKIWVSVPKDFDVVMITMSIIKSALIGEMSDLDSLQHELQKRRICETWGWTHFSASFKRY
ncbi:hypothetical protein BUALT_Bualt12G0041900 [Buddleja alternifolia]|uniref:NB-ARC domain-containing protein n=1 Tax=Buddleja alternifolia TaxID=168488 RepID=A0AAV6WNS7_9LAMI|nr:hypothetical protein BUALT_Bualt12G0041900 [Buddleja alternifolia]